MGNNPNVNYLLLLLFFSHNYVVICPFLIIISPLITIINSKVVYKGCLSNTLPCDLFHFGYTILLSDQICRRVFHHISSTKTRLTVEAAQIMSQIQCNDTVNTNAIIHALSKLSSHITSCEFVYNYSANMTVNHSRCYCSIKFIMQRRQHNFPTKKFWKAHISVKRFIIPSIIAWVM